jgi:hypothetical protein
VHKAFEDKPSDWRAKAIYGPSSETPIIPLDEYRLRVGHRQPDRYVSNDETKGHVEPEKNPPRL